MDMDDYINWDACRSPDNTHGASSGGPATDGGAPVVDALTATTDTYQSFDPGSSALSDAVNQTTPMLPSLVLFDDARPYTIDSTWTLDATAQAGPSTTIPPPPLDASAVDTALTLSVDTSTTASSSLVAPGMPHADEQGQPNLYYHTNPIGPLADGAATLFQQAPMLTQMVPPAQDLQDGHAHAMGPFPVHAPYGWADPGSMAYQTYYASNWGMPFGWNGQPAFPASTLLDPLPGPVLLPPAPRVPMGLNVRQAPYPTAARGPTRPHAAGPVRRQRRKAPASSGSRAPVVPPDNGTAPPRHVELEWHHTYAETYLDGRSLPPTTSSALHALEPNAQAMNTTLVPHAESQLTPEGHAAPGPSSSFALPSATPAPAAPVALSPPKFDYSNGRKHCCPVCVNDPDASAQAKKPLDAKGMSLHYGRLHDGYKEAHGKVAACVFCGAFRKIVRRGCFSAHRTHKAAKQTPCSKVVKLGGATAYNEMYWHLVEKGVPIDHWQIKESPELLKALQAIDARERANTSRTRDAPVAGPSRRAQAAAVEEAGTKMDADADGADDEEGEWIE
ncbi:hypothetical protein AURDEDRAFT_127839 [Auricularia subglabra TFB-10046 SS5]|uniref:Uncharacterized protein n=1 Tax=Auricularia subglabra (strain TFB-10046 / SS5) TaxID=717982 RepID=J0WY06_AURST|nr:hypothetical protein AURDEDRAFT_127839 [Auricularia subglabra TFB-10046 SS5]